MNKLNWGIVGCGDVTEKKSGPAFYNLPHTTLHAVMRRNEAAAADYALRHHVPTYYTDATKLINDPEVDAIYIATPPSSHMHYAIEALEAGKPVYVEKPMALNLAECEKMISVSQKTGVPLFVAYYRRHINYFKQIKAILDKGEIGTVLSAQIRFWRSPSKSDFRNDSKNWRLNVSIAGGGYFVDMASHQIDLLLWFFGKIQSVKGFASNRAALYQVEDTVEAIFEFESGVLAHGSWSFVAAEKDVTDRFEIIGTKGKISFSTFDMEYIRKEIKGIEELIVSHKPSIVEMPMIEYVSNLIIEGKQDVNALSDAGKVTQIIDEILSEYQHNSENKYE
ncbi:MAG: Gfo/Idh/MocA family oxidoreductase [Bacteroidales bacterium]